MFPELNFLLGWEIMTDQRKTTEKILSDDINVELN